MRPHTVDMAVDELWTFRQNWCTKCPTAGMANGKKLSGVPGLIWRPSGGGGSWVVLVHVPAELKGKVCNSKGKPLSKVIKTTGTADLAEANRVMPRIRMEILEGMHRQAGGELGQTREDALKSALAREYQRLRSNPKWLEDWNFSSQKLLELDQDIQTAISRQDPYDELQLLKAFKRVSEKHKEGKLRRLLKDNHLPSCTDLTEQQSLLRALKHVEQLAAQEQLNVEIQGLFAEPSAEATALAELAKPKSPVTLEQVADSRRAEYGNRSFENLQGLIKRWVECTGSNLLVSITKPNCRKFLDYLVAAEQLGGRGYSKRSANDQLARLLGQLKWHNQHVDEVADEIPIPTVARLKLSMEDRKQEKLAADARGALDSDTSRLIRFAVEDGCQWERAILIMRLAGLRISETMWLRWKHLRTVDDVLCIDLRDSKTVSGLRLVPLNSLLQQHLMPHQASPDQHIVFNAAQFAKRPGSSAATFMRRAQLALKPEGPINCHAFRHACSSEVQHHGFDRQAIDILGHSKTITQRYSRREMQSLANALEVVGQNLDLSSLPKLMK